MTHASDVEVLDFIPVVQDLLVEMVHTKDGAAAAVIALARSTAKERKHIVKTFKSYVSKIAFEEFGHVVLMAVFDFVDDTVASGKGVVAPLVDCIEAVLDNAHGRKVLLYLLAHRNSKYFTPEQLAPLVKWDGNPHTKKSHEARISELRAAALPAIYAVCLGTRALLLDVQAIYMCTLSSFAWVALRCKGDDEIEKRKFFFPQLIDYADFGCH